MAICLNLAAILFCYFSKSTKLLDKVCSYSFSSIMPACHELPTHYPLPNNVCYTYQHQQQSTLGTSHVPSPLPSLKLTITYLTSALLIEPLKSSSLPREMLSVPALVPHMYLLPKQHLPRSLPLCTP